MAKKKRANTLFNMASTLFLVTCVAAVALAGVYNVTKGPIEQVKKKKTENALKVVLPDFDRIDRKGMIAYDGGSDSLILYYAYKGEDLSGIAVETFTNKGFSGLIKIMVGFTPELAIHNTSVLEHKETPGLGDKMDVSKSDFPLQYMGINPAEFDLRMKKDGGQIDAITAATITSRAFSDAVDRAYQTLVSIKE
jgi:Na+-translocating ferredoxin:NAD+ oxidoreductase subunit G